MTSEILSQADDQRVVGFTRPFGKSRVDCEVPAGLSLVEIVQIVEPDRKYHRYIQVWIGHDNVPREHWGRVRPKPKATLFIAAPPKGDVGRAVLGIVVAVAAVAAGAFFGPAVAGALGVSAATGKALVGLGVTLVGSLLLNSLVPPPSLGIEDRDDRRAERLPSIRGASNTARRYDPIPWIAGRHFITPALAAEPVTELEGDDEYLRQIFIVGLGPLHISDIRIGETPVNDFDDVEVEVRRGFSGEAGHTLYPDVSFQDPLSITLRQSDGWSTRTTAPNVDEIGIDITFPQGLVRFNDEGKRRRRTVELEAQYRRVGDSGWRRLVSDDRMDVSGRTFELEEGTVTTISVTQRGRLEARSDVLGGLAGAHPIVTVFVDDEGQVWDINDRRGGDVEGFDFEVESYEQTTQTPWTTGGEDNQGWWSITNPFFSPQPSTNTRTVDRLVVSDGSVFEPALRFEKRQTRTVRRGFTRQVSRGQYEVRVRRLTSDTDDAQVRDEVAWTAIRGVRDESPIQAEVPLASIAIRVKATDQIQGAIDNLTCIAHSYMPDWTGSHWTVRRTRNPASAFRYALQSPLVKRPVPDERINLSNLQEWHEWCDDNDRRCDAVVSDEIDFQELLNNIASTGRASLGFPDSKYGVVRDTPQSVPVTLLTPRNIIGLEGERVFNQIPDALRVTYAGPDTNWQPDEIVVYNDGQGPDTAQSFDSLRMWGTTRTDQAWRDGRYHLAQAQLRPEQLQLTVGADAALILERGQRVDVNHDVMLVGLGYARISDITKNASDEITHIRLDEPVEMEAGQDYGVEIRHGADVVTREVVTDAGVTQDLELSEPAPSGAIDVDDIAGFGLSDSVSSDWVVKSIRYDNDWTARLTLIPHAPDIHDADTGDIPDHDPNVTLPPALRKPKRPAVKQIQTGAEVLERLPDGSVAPRIVATLSLAEGNGEPDIAEVWARVRESGDGELDWTSDGIDIQGRRRVVVSGVEESDRYDLRFRVRSTTNQLSDWRTVSSVEVIGSQERPSDVQDLTIDIVGDKAQLSWDPIPDGDLAYYRVRFSRATQGATWGGSVDLVRRVGRPATSVEVPAMVGTYLVKAVDQDGRTSVTAAAVTSTINRVKGLNFVEQLIEDPDYAGDRDRTVADDNLGGLRLDTATDVLDWDDVLDVDDVFLGPDGLAFEGTYTTGVIDLQSVFTARVTADISVTNTDLTDDVLALDDVLARQDIFGDDIEEDADVRVEMRTTDEDPSNNQWRDWKRFTVADHTARAYQFRLKLRSEEQGITPVVTEFRPEIDMPDRVDSGEAIVPSGGKRVDFDPAFFVKPDVGLSIQDGQSGDRYTKSVDAEGMDLEFFDSDGNSVERQIEWIARAYGEREDD